MLVSEAERKINLKSTKCILKIQNITLVVERHKKSEEQRGREEGAQRTTHGGRIFLGFYLHLLNINAGPCVVLVFNQQGHDLPILLSSDTISKKLTCRSMFPLKEHLAPNNSPPTSHMQCTTISTASHLSNIFKTCTTTLTKTRPQSP